MKKFIFTGIFAFLLLNISAQDDGFYGPENSEDPKRAKKELRQKKLEQWSFGGNFWLSFGTQRAYVELSPIALYNITPRFRVGGGITYIYSRFPNTYFRLTDSTTATQTVNSHTIGPKLYTDFILFDGSNNSMFNIGTIIAACEYSYLITDKLLQNPYTYEVSNFGKIPVNTLLLGGGIYQPLGGRGGLSFVVLFDVVNNDFSPYSNPLFRIGLYF